MDIGDINASAKPPTSKRMKPRAPLPPGAPQPAPRKIFTTPRNSVPDGGTQSGDTKENMLSAMVDLHVTLPDGFQTTGTVEGSKALMDLLVDLCSRYHLNPACHTLELLSPGGRPVAFKPNTLVGALGVRSVLIKEKVPEEKLMRKPPPKVPEKTVRLIVNYHQTQKAVVRVSPLVPLGSLVPVICEKCEFDPSHVILLKDNISNHEMDLDKSLNELGVREIYVLDQKLESIRSNTLSNSSEKKGFLGFFNFSRQKAKTSFKAPSSPCAEVRPNTLGQSQSVMNIPRMSPKAELKKRRAPPPPQPTPALCEVRGSVESCQVRSISPSGSQQKKRRAPAPPPIMAPSTPAEDNSVSEQSPAHSAGHSERGGSVRSTSSSCSSVGLGGDTVPQTTPSETQSALELKLEEAENNRHSTIGSERQVPLKPRRTPTREPPTLVIPPPPPDTPPPTQPGCHNAQLESDSEAQAQSWLHSLQGSEPNLSPERESETGSVGSGCSLPDQGYAPSEGTAEDSPFVSSPSDLTHPASPDGSVSPDGGPAPPRARSRALAKDSSSDSDEGCATWGSRHRHSNKIYPMEQADGMTDSYEDDAELSTQLHQTLAELEADLADDVEHTDQASVSESSISSSEKSYHNEIPVSVLHLEVPVTAINEVLEDQELGRANYEGFQPSDILFAGNQIPTYKPHSNIWTRSDTVNTVNSRSKAGMSSLHVVRSVRVPQKEINEVMAIPVTEIRDGPCKGDSCTDPAILKRQSQQLGSSARSVPSSPPRSPEHHTTSQGEIRGPTVEDETPRAMKCQMPQSTITQSPTSRFGLKTFTVIPPKPALTHTQKPAGSLVTGAIKIDALGNMVMQQNTHNKYGSFPGSGSDTELPLLKKAKAFWNSAEQQDGIPAPHSAVLKTKDPPFTRPAPDDSASKVRPEENPKDVMEASRSIVQEVERMPLTSEPSQQLTKSIKEPQQGRDLSFLKPPRRTSSQYVASAIAKYTGMPSTRMENKQELNAKTESTVSKQRFSSTNSIINGDRSTNVTSNKTNYNVSEDTIQMNGKRSSTHVANPKRSLSFPEYTTERMESSTVGKMDRIGKLGALQGDASANSLNADRGNMGFSMSAPIQVDTFVSVAAHSSSSALSAEGSGGLPVVGDPPSSAFPESRQVGVFGPVQKFRPVIPRAVPKERTLHSTLMEAIQSGDKKERLKKVSDTREGSLRAASYITAENERSALLAAIRVQNNSSRLRKTGSEAANELEGFRKSEGTSRFPSKSTFPLPPSVPPPPSHAPPSPPQPPTPIVPISMSTARNPEGARQALLEAIRSGLGAERLKKVPVPTKTVLVNGRLGTMRASSSIAQEH